MHRLSEQCSALKVCNFIPLTRKGVKLNHVWQVLVILPIVLQNEQFLHCQARYNTMGTEYEHETKEGLKNNIK